LRPRRRGLASLVASAAWLAGCVAVPDRASHLPAGAPPSVAQAGALGARAAGLASGLVGRPYLFGGSSPAGFDCSGLVWYVYHELGLEVPRTAAEQRAIAMHVTQAEIRPGDLVFFYTPDDHVGIYLGNGEFVHAPAGGRTVERARIDTPFFILGFAGAGRVTVR
jgi:cell wall-associated NlpC family hydrolase